MGIFEGEVLLLVVVIHSFAYRERVANERICITLDADLRDGWTVFRGLPDTGLRSLY